MVKVEGGKKERSPYALRDTYFEFDSFEGGTYYFYSDIHWNGKAADKTFCVNCYGPQKVDFIVDESINCNKQDVR